MLLLQNDGWEKYHPGRLFVSIVVVVAAVSGRKLSIPESSTASALNWRGEARQGLPQMAPHGWGTYGPDRFGGFLPPAGREIRLRQKDGQAYLPSGPIKAAQTRKSRTNT